MREGLPTEWVRGPQWASPAARLEWELVLTTAQAAWAELELLSVSEGVREAALLHLTPEELVRATHDAAGQGLLVVPLACEGGQTRAALTRPPRFADWLEAWSGCDDEAIGELLGFPGCCREHFCRTWGRGLTDTVATIARDGKIDGPPEANLLLRHLGVRLVPHLPCSPTCEATVALGKDLAHVVARAGVDPGPLYRLLNLPVTYSALHGVAVIETPHFRLWAGTDYTPDEVRVTRAETKPEIAHLQTRAAEVPAGAHIPGAPGSTPGPATTWDDNGFSTREAMDAAHATVLEAVGKVDSALDLGCGDGALLAKIADGRDPWQIFHDERFLGNTRVDVIS
ncbi:hypothetical protein LCGC14_1804870 [marine sediment metagenome]|uniref:Methyltransferase domain-containing protein n=1 Tax=marine sediment metagenome TaxID=412755 RepID=A0A0F9HBE1_9ZZZZ